MTEPPDVPVRGVREPTISKGKREPFHYPTIGLVGVVENGSSDL